VSKWCKADVTCQDTQAPCGSAFPFSSVDISICRMFAKTQLKADNSS
jgi:hypothetical protein